MFEQLMVQIAHWRMSTRRRVEFYRMLILMQRNIGNLLAALRDIESNFSEDGAHPYNPTALMAGDCADAFEGGAPLSGTLVEWVSEEEVMLIAAGEEAGNLQDGLRRAMESAQRAERIGKTLSKLIYPAAMLAGIGFLMQQVSTGVVPQLVRMSKGAALSLSGQILQWIAAVVNGAGVAGAIGCVGTILLIFVSLPHFRGSLRVMLEGIPPWSVYRDLKGASFLSQLTLLQGGGVELEEALIRLGDMASPWLRERAEGIARGVRNGLSLGDAAYEAGYRFPAPASIRFLRTVSGLNESSRSIEEFAEDWYDFTLERIDSLVMRSSTAGIVVFYSVILLIYSAMNDITNVMGNMPAGIK